MKKPILLDGPMGTEIERHGGDTSLPLWSARSLIETPELVRKIHADFIKNGAEVITTNTFRTQERTLVRAGYKGKGEELTKLAVELANEAKKGSSVMVAGSISPLEDCYSPHLVPPQSELRSEHSEMAKWLYDSGIDVFLVETMNTVREAKEAVNSAKIYDLPIWVGFTCDISGNILGGEEWSDVFEFAKENIDVLMVNCSTPKASLRALYELSDFKRETGSRIGIYPNYLFDLESGVELENIREDYMTHFDEILQLDPDVIGTCCGAVPEDTRILKKKLEEFYKS